MFPHDRNNNILGKIYGYVHVIFGVYEINGFVIKARTMCEIPPMTWPDQNTPWPIRVKEPFIFGGIVKFLYTYNINL